MQAIYEVPVIPNNLRHEETIVQIADVLDYLCNVFEDITSRVNNRVEVNKSRLSNLTQRIEKTSQKVAKLTGTKKATQVFSSSKYPASDIHKKYISVFSKSDGDSIDFVRTKIKIKDEGLTEQPLEKLQFYHVKDNEKLKQKSKYANIEEGLGTYPDDIESINEVLLFNTSKNPYKNYIVSDPLLESQRTRDVDPEESKASVGLDAAPLSITQRTALNRTVGENYFYSPGLGDVPTIDVPLDLPDLPGVADDLRYLIESGPGIAPSVTTTPIVPELPQIVTSPNDNSSKDELPKDSFPLPPLPEPPSTENVSQLQAPTPPVVPESQPTVDVPKEIVIQPEVSTSEPAPVRVTSEPPAANQLPVVEDARASLMESIRKAGGATKAKLRTTDAKKEHKSSGGGISLMADLHSKLALRRKGISGAKGSDGMEVSALNRVSAMIPPPPPPIGSELNESTNTEDEWDD